MLDWSAALGSWAAWFLGSATALLVVGLVAIQVCRQPARRLAIARSAVAGLWLLLAALGLPRFFEAVAVVGGLGATRTTDRTLVNPHPAISEDWGALGNPPTVDPILCATTLPIPHGCLDTPETSRDQPEWLPAVGCDSMTKVADLKDPYDSTSVIATSDPNRLAAGFGLLWLGGGLAALAWQAIGLLAARRLLRSAVEPPGVWRSVLKGLAKGSRRAPRLLVSPNAPGPLAVGLVRPTIVLPSSAVDQKGEPGGRVAAAIAHEYAHIQRGDLRLLALARWLAPVLIAHPLYWALRRLIRSDQEMLADAHAVAAVGGDPYKYAEALIEWAKGRAHGVGAAVGLGLGGRSDLKKRVARLLDHGRRVEPSCPRCWSLAFASATGLLVAALTVFGPVRAPASAAPHDCTDCEHTPQPIVVSAFLCPADAAPSSNPELGGPVITGRSPLPGVVGSSPRAGGSRRKSAGDNRPYDDGDRF